MVFGIRKFGIVVTISWLLAAPVIALNPLTGDYSKDNPLDIRIMAYNTLGRFIATPSADAAFNRIFTAIQPDLISLEEIPSSVSAATMAARFNSIMPIGGAGWQIHFGILGGTRNAIASRFPLTLKRTDTIPVSSTRGVTIALADLPNATYPVDVYLLSVHLKCCGNPGGTEDASRQRSADAIANWLGDARGVVRPAGDNIALPANTPIIILGDFNLVGGPQPETTLLTGDIQDNATFGADVKGDWDVTNLTNLNPLDPFTGNNFTWQGSTSFPPSALDRFMTADSAFNAVNKFILNTNTMTPAARTAAGLQAGDTLETSTSDHLPIVVDLRVANPCAVDTDNDGTPDCSDGCPTDPTRIAPGLCGCNVSLSLQGTGDVNGDTRVDAQDIQAFVKELITPTAPSLSACSADTNVSGTVTDADVDSFVNKLLGS
ncbi:MAG: endonuclease/exonuclease/phosphatase family protein [Planctomycetes bacterium]|nr:endonuclease/exonuclease/phosphatase family protein [Planctomycetota bacterium]